MKFYLIGVFALAFALRVHGQNSDIAYGEKNEEALASSASFKGSPEISVVPNPSVDIFTVNTMENYTVQVFDSHGVVVASFQTQGSNNSFGNDLIPGVYHINILKDKKVVKTFNVVKNW